MANKNRSTAILSRVEAAAVLLTSVLRLIKLFQGDPEGKKANKNRSTSNLRKFIVALGVILALVRFISLFRPETAIPSK